MSGCASARDATTRRRLAPWRRFFIFGLGFSACVGVAACGGGGGTKNPTAPKDTTPPEINQVSATLGDPNPGTLDLGKSDAQRVIATPTPLSLKVFATDDVTPIAKLKVQALDDSKTPLPGQTATLHNGLWEISTSAQAGMTVHIAATDEAGNQTEWPYAAVFPTRTQALVHAWTLLIYSNVASAGGVYPVSSRPKDTLTATTWCQENDLAGNGPQGGTWSVQSDGRLKLETRHHMPCTTTDFGTQWDTIESTRVSDFYVDATYFSDSPYTRAAGGSASDITGTWSYKVDITSGGQTNTLTPTLVLNQDGTFSQTTEDGHTLSGTYKVEPNPNYSADFGQLLVATVDTQDGASVTPVLVVHYFKVTQDLELLLDPFVQVPT